mmetsp:Transcript_5047/g.12750  ORF Transcript_5047/g.12750 Transcript_5047/m.12750 type:complete len:204 (-) Transcript_5047:2464-3075(-)
MVRCPRVARGWRAGPEQSVHHGGGRGQHSPQGVLCEPHPESPASLCRGENVDHVAATDSELEELGNRSRSRPHFFLRHVFVRGFRAGRVPGDRPFGVFHLHSHPCPRQPPPRGRVGFRRDRGRPPHVHEVHVCVPLGELAVQREQPVRPHDLAAAHRGAVHARHQLPGRGQPRLSAQHLQPVQAGAAAHAGDRGTGVPAAAAL